MPRSIILMYLQLYLCSVYMYTVNRSSEPEKMDPVAWHNDITRNFNMS